MRVRRGDPRLYDERRNAALQSDVPSQQTEAGTPYFPSEIIEGWQTTPGAMADAALAAMQEARNNPAGDISSFTRYTFDSLPPMGIDFAGPINDGSQTAIQLFDGSFTIPVGYVGIVRGFNFTTSAEFFTMDQFGGFGTSAQITLLRNGVPIPGLTNINVSQWGMATVTFPVFIMLNAGDRISGQWNNGAVLYQFGNGFFFWGNLLLDDGRNLPLQSGNMRPEPVVEVDTSAIGNVPPGAIPVGPPATAGLGIESQTVNSSSSYLVFDAPMYPGPFPPNVGVDTYNRLREAHHIQVRSAYLAFARSHPGATIDVKGATGDALAPYAGE